MLRPLVQVEDYYPFGLTFNSYQRESSFANKYQYSGKELETALSLSWLDFGARRYSAELGRWISTDPLSSQYFSLSPYNFVNDNPIKFIDPDGEKFIVFGERYGFLGLRRRRYEYTPEIKPPDGADNFTQRTFASLDYDRLGDGKGIIDQIANSDDKNVKIKRTGRTNGFYNHNNSTIRWNPNLAARMIGSAGEETGTQPAASILFHEVAHAFRHKFKTDEYFADLAIDDSQYGNLEERKVIEQYETPAAKALGHGTRTSHGAEVFNPEPQAIKNVEKHTKLDGGPPNRGHDPGFLGSAGPADKRQVHRMSRETN